MNELATMIRQTKGKFFSLTFIKADGTKRVVNGKNSYKRLIAGGRSTLTGTGYVSIVDRNKAGGQWIAAHGHRVVEFKCGKLQKRFIV